MLSIDYQRLQPTKPTPYQPQIDWEQLIRTPEMKRGGLWGGLPLHQILRPSPRQPEGPSVCLLLTKAKDVHINRVHRCVVQQNDRRPFLPHSNHPDQRSSNPHHQNTNSSPLRSLGAGTAFRYPILTNQQIGPALPSPIQGRSDQILAPVNLRHQLNGVGVPS